MLAAADSGSELAVFAAAAPRLGIDLGDLEPAETGGLLRIISGTVRFRHPLIRAAAYQDAPLARRLSTHRALAADRRDPDRRAWHLAAAAAGVDDDAAAELDRAAERAVTRGAPVAGSRAWERAAGLSSSPAGRARRLVAAARAAYDGGELDRAGELADAAAALTTDIGERAEAGWVRAQIAYERESPARASLLALLAAEPLVDHDPEHATAVLTEAAWCARDAGDAVLLDRCAALLDRIDGDRAAAVKALIGLVRGEPEAAVPAARKYLLAAREGTVEETLQRLLAGFLGTLIGADEVALEVLDEHVAGLRRDGALGWLPYAQESLAQAQLVAGRLHDADVMVTEASTLAGELGQDIQVTSLAPFAAWLAAVRGDRASFQRHHDHVVPDDRGHKLARAIAVWAGGIADLTRSEPARALEQLDQVCRGTTLGDVTIRAIPD